MTKRRVMLVSPVGTIGGGEQVLLSLARHLPDYGYEPSFAIMRDGPLASEAGRHCREVVCFPPHRYREIGRVLAATNWLAERARKIGVEVLHANHAAHIYASRAAKKAGLKEVWHLHDYPYQRDLVMRVCSRLSTNHIIYTTPHVRSGFPDFNRRFPHSIVPPSAVESIETAPTPEIRQRFGLAAASRIVLTVSRTQPHKGHVVLLDAAERMRSSHPEAVFVITGEPTDGPQRDYWSKIVDRIRVRSLSNVRLVGFVKDAELTALYKEASVLAHPALSEGFGLVLLEAMRAGTPVVAADSAGASFIIENGSNGLLVPKSDAEAMARDISRVLDDESLASRLTKGGKATLPRFLPSAMGSSVAKIYNELTNG